jgi:oligopeptide/dipeptide ABC transporter ATP-binding protein
MGLVGETGSGKSVTGASILRLLKRPGRVVGGQIHFAGRDLLQLSEAEMQRVRGREIAMIFQNPRAALNPLFTVGDLMAEVIMRHKGVSRAEARHQAVELLRSVHIPEAERRLEAYPHQLSGGMCQRVMIALALSCGPKLLIADEPTTGLDVTTQFQVVQLLKEMQQKLGTALMVITHDLGLAAQLCDVIAVMYLGDIVEWAPVGEIFTRPRHPYTQGLLAARPRVGQYGELAVIPGSVPDPRQRPGGCPFRTRCAFAVAQCATARPGYSLASESHRVACHRWEVTG